MSAFASNSNRTFQDQSDAELLTRVGIALTLRLDRSAHAIDIQVDNAVVKLGGVVATATVRNHIVDRVRHMAGVRAVVDELEVLRSELPLVSATGRERSSGATPLPPDFKRRSGRWAGSLPRLWKGLFAAVVAASLVGCGEAKPERVPTFPVTGSITFKGGPIPGAFVAMHPKTPLPNVPAPRASVGPDGKLKISTYDGGDGAPEGEYVLTVEWYKPIKTGADVVPGPNVIPKKYTSPRTSGLVVSVAANATELPPIKL
ncbi:MAG: BON domain-containing protein [Pirellulales bacterium]|nr:BON domain-containing protein [Pirellulales bacterium]